MSQDRGEPPDVPRDGDAGPADSGAAPDADHTQAFDPRSEPDHTQAFDPGSEPDATRPLRPAAGSRDVPDQTQAFDPRSGSDPTRQQPADAPAWAGRAGVPQPRPTAGPAEPTGWGEYDSSGGRPWWTPIVIGLVALIFLGVLGVALWLASDRGDRDSPVNPSPSPTSREATRTPTPTVTTGRPTPSRTSAAPVTVPPLVGLPLRSAQALLDDLGLKSRLEFVPSGQPEATVIDTDPGAGAVVARGDTVTLVVAQPRRSPPTSATPGATTPPSPGA